MKLHMISEEVLSSATESQVSQGKVDSLGSKDNMQVGKEMWGRRELDKSRHISLSYISAGSPAG